MKRLADLTEGERDRLDALLARLIVNHQMPRSEDVLLDPDWTVIPAEIAEQIEDLLGRP